MMVEVTQEDQEAAEDAITCTTLRGEELAYEFARHRIAAEQRGKLEGARLAIEAAKTKIRQFDPEHYSVENDDGDMICSIIADDLATLDPAKIVGEG